LFGQSLQSCLHTPTTLSRYTSSLYDLLAKVKCWRG